MSEHARILTSLFALATFSLANVATAQSGSTPPSGLPATIEVRAPDENGVDMYTGLVKFSNADVSIGDMTHVVSSLPSSGGGSGPLAFTRSAAMMDNYRAIAKNNGCHPGPCIPSFEIGTEASSEVFTIDASNGNFRNGTNGGALISDPESTACANLATTSCGAWLYVQRNGTAVSLSNGMQGSSVLSKIVHPDGLVERVVYAPSQSGQGALLAVNRSDGLQLKYQYGSNWDLQGVMGVNSAYEFCDSNAEKCEPSSAWPSSAYTWGASAAGADTVLTISDSAGRATRYTLDGFGRVTLLKPPSSNDDVFKFDYCWRRSQYPPIAPGPLDSHECFYFWSTYTSNSTSTVYIEDRVLTVTRDAQTWNYGYPVQSSNNTAGQTATMLPLISKRPDGKLTIANQSEGTNYLVDYSAPGTYATFEQNPANRLSSASSWAKGGVNYVYTYDARGNVLSDGFVSASYDTVCQNYKTCNQPNWVRDAKGNQTDYTYYPEHGGVKSVTSPAGADGIRPQTRFYYAQRYAWFLNASGQMVRSTDPVWKLVSQSSCRKGAPAAGGGCALPDDETVTTYDYGPDSGPNNLWLRGTVVTANGVSRRSCYSYDRLGHRLGATSPMAGLTSCP